MFGKLSRDEIDSDETNCLSQQRAVLCMNIFIKTLDIITQKNIVKMIDCRCIALDLRGHGGTSTENDHDMSAAVLAR